MYFDVSRMFVIFLIIACIGVAEIEDKSIIEPKEKS